MNNRTVDFEGRGSRELPAQPWPGDRPLVQVACNRSVGGGRWEPDVTVVLEWLDTREGASGAWQKVAEFDRDTEATPAIGPGKVRFRVQQSDEFERGFSLSISQPAAPSAKPPSTEQKVAGLEQRVARLEEAGLDPAA